MMRVVVVSHETPDSLATFVMSVALVMLVVFGPIRMEVGIVRLEVALCAPRGVAHDFSPSRQGVTLSAGTLRVGDVPHAAKIVGATGSLVKATFAVNRSLATCPLSAETGL
jgi:hypothetical protein